MGNCASSSPVAPAPRRLGSRSKSSSCLSLFSANQNSEESGASQSRITDTGFLTHCGIISRQGGKGCNQDATVAWERIFGNSTASICGVFDGHGPHGHLVARHIRDNLPQQLAKALKIHLRSKVAIKSSDAKQDLENDKQDAEDSLNNRLILQNESLTYYSTESTFGGREMPLETHVVYEAVDKNSWIKAFADSFKALDDSLRLLKKAIPKCSGCTAAVAIWHGIEFTVACLGDSRCVLGTADSNGSIIPVQLTADQKPSVPEERKRIESKGGRVMPLQMSPEIMRVWLPTEDSPGLAMSRAFGDYILKRYGVTNIPSVHCRKLTTSDKFVVLATDGVWDVLSNQEAVDIVARSFPKEAAAEVLKEARKKWELSYRPSQVDDISVAVLHFPSSWSQLPKPDSAHFEHWNWSGH